MTSSLGARQHKPSAVHCSEDTDEILRHPIALFLKGGWSASSVSSCHIAIGYQGRAFSLAYHSRGVAWEPYIADVVLLCCGWGVADVAPVRVNTVRAWIRGCFPRAPVRIVPHVPLCVSPRKGGGGVGIEVGGWVAGGKIVL